MAMANQQKADLFISLHLNSVQDPGAHGAETYFLSLQASDEGAARAAAIENQSDPVPQNDGDPLYDLQLILWDLAQSHYLAESQRLAALVQEELNEALPDGFEYVNTIVDKRKMGLIVDDLAANYPKAVVAGSLDAIKDLAFHFAARSVGASRRARR